jgi:hypothetical protein
VADATDLGGEPPAASAGKADQAPPIATRIMFAPVRIAEKRIAPRLARRLFARIWSVIDSDEPPPRPEERQESVGKLALALALEGACAAIVGGLLDQAARRRFARLTGRWPSRKGKS